jgi:hypothetical protein
MSSLFKRLLVDSEFVKRTSSRVEDFLKMKLFQSIQQITEKKEKLTTKTASSCFKSMKKARKKLRKAKIRSFWLLDLKCPILIYGKPSFS